MYKKTLLCSILLITSSTIIAEPVSTTHYEAKAGTAGLIAGSLVAGPFGAIIGGSIGVLTGHQQSQSEQITEQQKFITDLEHELANINTELSQSKVIISQLTTKQLQIESALHQQGEAVKKIASAYQFDIYFLSNSDTIQSQAQQGLLKLATLLKNNPAITARIEAHSDWRGSDDENFKLAQKRLDSVTDYLSNQGTNQVQLQTTNYGENRNKYYGSWGDDLFYDRRVTITLICFAN